MYAILLLPLAPWMILLLVMTMLVAVTVQLLARHQSRNLLLTHSTEGWTLESSCQSTRITGNLVQAGYRSAWLIILVIQSRNTALHRVIIWQDQISSRDFSYLHLQMAYAAIPAARRTAAIWLMDMARLRLEGTRAHSGGPVYRHTHKQRDQRRIR